MNSTPRFMLISGWGIGRGVHIVRARVRAKMGAIMNMEMEDASGRRGSLVNNFTASAMGCSSPWGPTTFGPLRSCIYPRTFRSTRVRNATARRIGIMVERSVIRYIVLKRGFEPLIVKV